MLPWLMALGFLLLTTIGCCLEDMSRPPSGYNRRGLGQGVEGCLAALGAALCVLVPTALSTFIGGVLPMIITLAVYCAFPGLVGGILWAQRLYTAAGAHRKQLRVARQPEEAARARLRAIRDAAAATHWAWALAQARAQGAAAPVTKHTTGCRPASGVWVVGK